MGVFEIYGNAKRIVNYDVAVIKIEFVASEKTSFAASAKVMGDCENFLTKIEKSGMDSAAFMLEEDEVTEKSYIDDGKIEATRCILIKIPFMMERINLIRDILDTEKYDIHFELDYELSNEDRIREELLKEALIDSKKKAEQLADVLGMQVKGVKSVETYRRSRDSVEMDWMENYEPGTYFDCETEHPKSNALKAKEATLDESIEVKWEIK